MRDLDQEPGAVAGIILASAGTAVVQVEQCREAVADELMRFPPLQVDDEAHAAAIVFVRGSYRPWAGGRPELIVSFLPRPVSRTTGPAGGGPGRPSSGTTGRTGWIRAAGSSGRRAGDRRGPGRLASARPPSCPASLRSGRGAGRDPAPGLGQVGDVAVISLVLDQQFQELGRRRLEAALPPVNDRQRAGQPVVRAVALDRGRRPASPP